MDTRTRPVVHAVPHDGPAVVAAGFDEVEFIAALWAVLVLPEVPRLRMHSHPLRIAVAPRPDLGVDPFPAHKRVVLRDPAVVVDPERAPVVVRQILRRVRQIARRRPLAVAQRHEQVSVVVEDETSAPHRAPVGTVPECVRVEKFLDIREPVVLEPAPGDGDRAQRVRPRLDVAEIEEAVRLELRVKDRVAQSRLLEAAHGTGAAAKCPDRWQALDGVSQENPVADDSKPSGALGYEKVALGRERHRERTHQAVGHLFDPELVERGADNDDDFTCRERIARSAPGDWCEEDEKAETAKMVHREAFRPGCVRLS